MGVFAWIGRKRAGGGSRLDGGGGNGATRARRRRAADVEALAAALAALALPEDDRDRARDARRARAARCHLYRAPPPHRRNRASCGRHGCLPFHRAGVDARRPVAAERAVDSDERARDLRRRGEGGDRAMACGRPHPAAGTRRRDRPSRSRRNAPVPLQRVGDALAAAFVAETLAGRHRRPRGV